MVGPWNSTSSSRSNQLELVKEKEAESQCQVYNWIHSNKWRLKMKSVRWRSDHSRQQEDWRKIPCYSRTVLLYIAKRIQRNLTNKIKKSEPNVFQNPRLYFTICCSNGGDDTIIIFSDNRKRSVKNYNPDEDMVNTLSDWLLDYHPKFMSDEENIKKYRIKARVKTKFPMLILTLSKAILEEFGCVCILQIDMQWMLVENLLC